MDLKACWEFGMTPISQGSVYWGKETNRTLSARMRTAQKIHLCKRSGAGRRKCQEYGNTERERMLKLRRYRRVVRHNGDISLKKLNNLLK